MRGVCVYVFFSCAEYHVTFCIFGLGIVNSVFCVDEGFVCCVVCGMSVPPVFSMGYMFFDVM